MHGDLKPFRFFYCGTKRAIVTSTSKSKSLQPHYMCIVWRFNAGAILIRSYHFQPLLTIFLEIYTIYKKQELKLEPRACCVNLRTQAWPDPIKNGSCIGSDCIRMKLSLPTRSLKTEDLECSL